MSKRPFWLGLLLGTFTSFGLFLRRTVPADTQNSLLDLASDAFVVCDAAGTVFSANAAARQLLGPDCAGLSSLYYPTGQRVPPSQLPHVRVLRSGRSVPQAEYHLTSLGGVVHILRAKASALPGGKAAVVFQEVTALRAAQARLDEALEQQAALHRLGRRLNAAAADTVVRAIAEETYALLGSLPDVQVRLYEYNPAVQRLTCLASEPEDRPKRPKSAADAQPPQFPFDAGVPALWQLYIARQPSSDCLYILGEVEAASALALPLLSGGLALGHLSVSSSAAKAFNDPPLLQTLSIAASAAALALSAPQAAHLAKSYQAQLDAVKEISQAIAAGASLGELVDLVSVWIKRATNAALCTVSVEVNGELFVAGEAFRDDLLHPERSKPNSPPLQSKAAWKAWRTQKAVTHLGLGNPSIDAGAWRVFAGKAGQYSVTALPLASRRGVLAVYWEGAAALPEAQIKFLQTIAAFVSMGLMPATTEEAAED